MVVAQAPNLPIIGWFVCTVASYLLANGVIKTGLIDTGRAFLFTWAFLEITQGKSYFRQLLGAIIMIGVLTSFFGN